MHMYAGPKSPISPRLTIRQLQLRLPLDYREKARGGLGPKALGHLRKGEAKGKRLAKQAKGRGAAAGLRQPRAINASAGKRRC